MATRNNALPRCFWVLNKLLPHQARDFQRAWWTEAAEAAVYVVANGAKPVVQLPRYISACGPRFKLCCGLSLDE